MFSLRRMDGGVGVAKRQATLPIFDSGEGEVRTIQYEEHT